MSFHGVFFFALTFIKKYQPATHAKADNRNKVAEVAGRRHILLLVNRALDFVVLCIVVSTLVTN